jgi:RNA polymerase sigma-70 factor, ECF subfamily
MDEATTTTTTLSVEEAWTAHHEPLVGWLRGFTRDPELAEDLAQEAFLRLAREDRDGRAPEHTRGWLYRVASNLAVTHGRRATVARREMGRLADTGTSRSPEDEVAAREELRVVLTRAGGLTTEDRKALALAAAEYTNQEMANALQVSAGAARTRLCRARARLAKQIA